MSSTIERVSGRDRLITAMCDPQRLILEYSVIASGAENPTQNGARRPFSGYPVAGSHLSKMSNDNVLC